MKGITSQEHFIHEPVRLVEMKDEVELAHVAEVLVEHLHKVVDHV